MIAEEGFWAEMAEVCIPQQQWHHASENLFNRCFVAFAYRELQNSETNLSDTNELLIDFQSCVVFFRDSAIWGESIFSINESE